MDPHGYPYPFDPLDAWEKLIEQQQSLDCPGFEDPFSKLADCLEGTIESRYIPAEPMVPPDVPPPRLVPEERHFALPGSQPEPPLPYCEDTVSPAGRPEIFLPLAFHSASRRAGHVGAGIRNTQSSDDQRYCPLEETWLPAERCTACEYAEKDSLGNVTCRGWDEIGGSSPESEEV